MSVRERAALAAVAILVGVVCGLPHLLIPLHLPDPRAYTPLVIGLQWF